MASAPSVPVCTRETGETGQPSLRPAHLASLELVLGQHLVDLHELRDVRDDGIALHRRGGDDVLALCERLIVNMAFASAFDETGTHGSSRRQT